MARTQCVFCLLERDFAILESRSVVAEMLREEHGHCFLEAVIVDERRAIRRRVSKNAVLHVRSEEADERLVLARRHVIEHRLDGIVVRAREVNHLLVEHVAELLLRHRVDRALLLRRSASRAAVREAGLFEVAMHTALIFAEVRCEVAAMLECFCELVRRLRVIDAVLAVFRVVVRHVVDELLVVVEVEIFAIIALDAAVVVIFACELAVAAVALVRQLCPDEVGREPRVLRDSRSDVTNRQARKISRRSAAIIGRFILRRHAVARLDDFRRLEPPHVIVVATLHNLLLRRRIADVAAITVCQHDMVVVAVDDDIARFEVVRVERDDLVARVADECIDVDNALAEFVRKERVVACANLRDRLDAAVCTVLHVLSHEILCRVHDICTSTSLCTARCACCLRRLHRDSSVRHIDALRLELVAIPLRVLLRVKLRNINTVSRRHIVILARELCRFYRVNVRVRYSRRRDRLRPRDRAAICRSHSRKARVPCTASRTEDAHRERAHSGGTSRLHLILRRVPERAIRLAAVLVLELLLCHLLHILAEHIGRSIENVRRNSTLPAALPKAAERVAAEDSTIEAGREHINRQLFADHTVHLAEDLRVREPLILQVIVDTTCIDSSFKWAARQRIASEVIRARLHKIRSNSTASSRHSHALQKTACAASECAADTNLRCQGTGHYKRNRATSPIKNISHEAARIRQVVRVSESLQDTFVLVSVQCTKLLLHVICTVIPVSAVVDEPVTKTVPPRVGVNFAL